MKFESERLSYREFTESDIHRFYAVFSNEQTMRYAWIDRYNCEEEALPYFKKVLENNAAVTNRMAYEYAVFLSSDNTFIGFADIEIQIKNDLGGCGEVGYFLLPEFWGYGYATEMANRMMEICFNDLGLHRVWARCNANNRQSERVMMKIGMTQEGEFRKVRFKNNRWENEKHFSILVDEWRKL